MDSKDCAPDLADLEAIDRVARAAHLWIRHGRAFGHLIDDDGPAYGADGPAHHNLVAGVISGLCEAFELNHRCALLSAYAYALIESETGHALAIASALHHRPIETRYLSAFEAGRAAAENLIAMLVAAEPAPRNPCFRGPHH